MSWPEELRERFVSRFALDSLVADDVDQALDARAS